jgi:small subunit ribosomal protein S17
MAEARGRRRTLVGRVTSSKMDKTVVVAVEVVHKHPLYGRPIRRTHKFKAHDATNQCHAGDTVEIRENRPLSREKRWVVAQLIKTGHEEIPIIDQSVPQPETPAVEAPAVEAPAAES